MRDLRDKAAIVGIGETAYVRNAARTLESMVFEACATAIADAGLNPKDIDGIVLAGGADAVPPREFELNFGATKVGYAASSAGRAGSGNAHAPLMAALAIDAGLCQNVLIWQGMNVGSSGRSPGAFHDADHMKHQFETPYGWYGQPSHLAMVAQRHMYEYGTTSAQLGAIAVASRKHAIMNGNAVMRTPITLEDYFNSRWISEPFRLLDCCLMNDGAGALVVTSAERARDLPNRPVYIAGGAYDVGKRSAYWAQQPDITCTMAVRTAPEAYRMAGLGPQDVDVALMYDCFTWVVLAQLEDHGFCKKGEGGAFVEGGRIEIGGELPVNTHGGNLSQSYLVGMNHLCEAVRQLRGTVGAAQVQDCHVALVGGYGAMDYASLILRN